MKIKVEGVSLINDIQMKWLEVSVEGIALLKIPSIMFLHLTTTGDSELRIILKKAKPLEFYFKPEIQKDMIVAPHLQIDSEGQICGHEGRHRVAAAMLAGFDVVEVGIVARESGWVNKNYGWRWQRNLPMPPILYPQFRVPENALLKKTSVFYESYQPYIVKKQDITPITRV